MKSTIALIVLAAGMTASVASAQVSYTVYATATADGAPPSYFADDRTGATPQAALASASGTYLPGDAVSGSATASAFAGAGLLRVSASGSQSGGWDVYRGAFAQAYASFTEVITVNPANPALLGTSGSFTASMLITGSLSANFSGGANANWSGNDEGSPPQADISFSANSSTGMISNGGGGFTISGPAPRSEFQSVYQVQSFVVPFTFGTPFTLSASLTASGGALTASPSYLFEISSAGGASLFGNSATWQGITSIVGGGQEIGLAGASVGSASGTDYTNAVPTPGAAALLAIGGLMTTRRRRV